MIYSKYSLLRVLELTTPCFLACHKSADYYSWWEH